LQPTHFAVLHATTWREEQSMRFLNHSFSRTVQNVRRHVSEFEYFRIVEFGEDAVHLHVLIRAGKDFDKGTLKKYWGRATTKEAHPCDPKPRVYCEPIRSVEAVTIYSLKATKRHIIRTKPRGEKARMISCSRRFLIAKRADILAELKEEWINEGTSYDNAEIYRGTPAYYEVTVTEDFSGWPYYGMAT
jgi:hypothetical protein